VRACDDHDHDHLHANAAQGRSGRRESIRFGSGAAEMSKSSVITVLVGGLYSRWVRGGAGRVVLNG
jgi:hypothetical protein